MPSGDPNLIGVQVVTSPRTARRLHVVLQSSCVIGLTGLALCAPDRSLPLIADPATELLPAVAAAFTTHTRLLIPVGHFIAGIASNNKEPIRYLVPALCALLQDVLTPLWRQLHDHFKQLSNSDTSQPGRPSCLPVRLRRSCRVPGAADEMGSEPSLAVVLPCPSVVSYGHDSTWQGSGVRFLQAKRAKRRPPRILLATNAITTHSTASTSTIISKPALLSTGGSGFMDSPLPAPLCGRKRLASLLFPQSKQAVPVQVCM